jgi:hypothetical protein
LDSLAAAFIAAAAALSFSAIPSNQFQVETNSGVSTRRQVGGKLA